MNNKHIGSNFDDFLQEEGILAEAEAKAIKRVIAYQVEQEMKKQGLSKNRMAKLMNTSRACIDRLLNPENTSITLNTMEKAAQILGKKLQISLG